MPTICDIPTRVETRLGYLSHVLSGSSGGDPVYKISGSDLDSALDHMRAYLKSTELLYNYFHIILYKFKYCFSVITI